MSFGQFASTTQFYLYGKKYCTQTGWKSASENYPTPDILTSGSLSLEGRVYFLTGANSGIGFEIASFLASRMATVYMICRNRERAEKAQQVIKSKSNNTNVFVIICDCGVQADVRSAWVQFVDHQINLSGTPRLDGLMCNAGALTNEKTVTSEGIETTLAAHLLFGTYLLTTLAIPVLETTPGSRVVVVSSGGMYNTKFPSWDEAAGLTGKYDGQFAYAYAKRGQVLLCERWTTMYPSLKFATCHPGWVDTPGVASAYGDKKSYLEPLRNLWEGSEGIIWLLVVDRERIEGGGFYLDRTPRVKHMAGPFFTEGSFTKNTAQEVDDMMANLRRWSSHDGAESPVSWVRNGEIISHQGQSGSLRASATCAGPLRAMVRPIDIKSFMGRWYVQANIPTIFDRDTVNNIEDYIWDEGRKLILVSFKYRSALLEKGEQDALVPGPQKEVRQQGTIMNDASTEWSLAVKFVIYWTLPTRYLIIGLDEIEGEEGSYSSCMIGVPDRSYVWIMTRSSETMSDAHLNAYVDIAADMGYDRSQIVRVPFIPVAEDTDVHAKSITALADHMTPGEKKSAIEDIFATLGDEDKADCIRRLRSAST